MNILPVIFFVVITNSMYPAIKPGSLLVIKKDVPVTVGDVIAYKYKNAKDVVVTHRVTEAMVLDGRQIFRTKGDFNKFADPLLVSQNEVVGKLIFQIPVMGNVISSFNFLAVFFYAPAGFFVGGLLSRVFKRK